MRTFFPTKNYIKPAARHLGGTVSFNQSCRYELQKRIMALRACWSSLDSFWTKRVRRNLKRNMIYANVIEPGLSGLISICPSRNEMNALTSLLCKYLLVL